MKEQDDLMSDIEINKVLHEMARDENESSIKRDIAMQSIETLNPAKYITEIYKDKGLKYSLDEQFFIHHVGDIYESISNHEGDIKLSVGVENYYIELSYIAYQIRLQELLFLFRRVTKEEMVF